MHFLDTRLRIQHDCPFCSFSKQFPEAEMVLWYSRESEVLQITAPDRTQL